MCDLLGEVVHWVVQALSQTESEQKYLLWCLGAWDCHIGRLEYGLSGSFMKDDGMGWGSGGMAEPSPSELMEIVIPEVGGIDDDILLTIKDDILRKKLLNVEEISSGSTTTHSDISLPEYEVFHDDHVKEISSGSPTIHSDSSLYASFIFDLSINPFPPVEPNSRDFTKDVVEDISPNKEPQVHNALPTHPTLQLNLKFQPSSEYIFTYVVWIFLPLIVYSVAPYYLLSLRNEDTIFDPGICNYHSFYVGCISLVWDFPKIQSLA
nr:hypothetical protein [Tanacetum cinerariifolium]